MVCTPISLGVGYIYTVPVSLWVGHIPVFNRNAYGKVS